MIVNLRQTAILNTRPSPQPLSMRSSSHSPSSLPKPPPKLRSRKFDNSTPDTHLKKQSPYKGILGTGKTPPQLKLCLWNVNGIRSILSKNVLHNFITKYSPDIFCVNETKINKELYDKTPIYIKGYNGYWNFCKCSAGYSGVAIFSKFLPIAITEDIDEPAYSQEGRVITLEFEQFYVVAVYIPSAGGKELERLYYKTQQYEVAFQRYCQDLRKRGKPVIVCGDMNVSAEEIDIHLTANTHKQPGFTPQQRKSFRKFLQLGWVDTFRKLNPTKREYTWWRIEHGNRERNIGKRLDYFLVNQEHSGVVVKSVILRDVMGSDHCPVAVEVDLGKGDSFGKENETEREKQQSVSLCAEENMEKIQTAEEKIFAGVASENRRQPEKEEKPQHTVVNQGSSNSKKKQSVQELSSQVQREAKDAVK